ncbi:putative Ig domain-containing protein [Leptospira sp. FAT2]|nr:putative Ig domain-containing protein [Leptospira sanjuanensis]MCG6194168.1 putative Ig domain-containing protein [Leptospira sanjuanensis]
MILGVPRTSGESPNDDEPPQLSFSYPTSSYRLIKNVPVVPICPDIQGDLSNFSITPPLPAGLVINPATGTITGSPASPLPVTSYQVTASNSSKSFSVSLNLSADALNAEIESYIKAPNAEVSDQFGKWIAIDGDTLVVGAPIEDSNQTSISNSLGPNLTPAGDNDAATFSGAAYVFRRTGATWAFEAYLKAPNAEVNDQFGEVVAIDRDTIVVGSFFETSNQTSISNSLGPNLTPAGDDDSIGNAGAAYVFRRTGSTWAFEAYLKPPNIEVNDLFAKSIAVDGDTVVIGANAEDSNQTSISNSLGPNLTPAGDDDSAGNSGAAYVFRRTGATWAFEAYLKAPNAEGNDFFGSAVAIDGDTIAVASASEDSNQTSISNILGPNLTPAGDNDSANGSGAVYIFRRTGTLWSFESYLKAPNAEAGDSFGSSIAIDGNTLVVGACNEDSNQTSISNSLGPNLTPAGDNDSASNSGAAYVYRRTGATWAFEAYLKAPNAESGDLFGYKVAIDNGFIAISAIMERGGGAISLHNPQPAFTPANDNDSAVNAGAVYVFRWDANVWVWQSYVKGKNTEGNDRFGESIGISGELIAVGALGEDSANAIICNGAANIPTGATDNEGASGSGAAYVFAR